MWCWDLNKFVLGNFSFYLPATVNITTLFGQAIIIIFPSILGKYGEGASIVTLKEWNGKWKMEYVATVTP